MGGGLMQLALMVLKIYLTGNPQIILLRLS